MPVSRTRPSTTTTDSNWTFLNNHTHVLLCLPRNHRARLRELARMVGITERAVQIILKNLEDYGVLQRFRRGRCNYYEIDAERPMRHALESNHTVGDLLDLFLSQGKDKAAEKRSSLYLGKKLGLGEDAPRGWFELTGLPRAAPEGHTALSPEAWIWSHPS